MSDERERRLVEPRLAHLLGLEQRTATDRGDLFNGWRLFFERLAETEPVVLAFEDLQYADSGLLDFIDYLLEWSAEFPFFILALGRPELLNARPIGRRRSRWGRSATAPWETCSRDSCPGLPDELLRPIVTRAEGMPLYGVETVRMLLDRGLLTQEGNRYLVSGNIDELDVPETLHALAAARLDGLTHTERSVLQDAAVCGNSFTPAGVAALGSLSEDEVRDILQGLVSKQILGFNDDRLSSERGQFHFLQGLLRTTAYGTLSRRDRKSRHLAVARHLQEAWGDEAPELAEVLAAHLLDAADAEPDAVDAPQIRAMACDTLADAGERALSLALGREAQRAFEHAAELAAEDNTRATLLEKAGRAAHMNTDLVAARARFEEAVRIFEALGDHAAVSRSLVGLSYVLYSDDHLEEAIEISRRAVAGLADGTAEKAAALAELSSNLAFHGDSAEALAAADASLAIAEPLRIGAPCSTRSPRSASFAGSRGASPRRSRSGGIRSELAIEHDLTIEALRDYNNLADLPLQQDRFAEAIAIAEPGLKLARERGHRRWEQALNVLIATANVARGEWEGFAELTTRWRRSVHGTAAVQLPPLPRPGARRTRRQGGPRARSRAREDELEGTSNVELVGGPMVARAIGLRALGREADALEVALPIATGPADIPNEVRREAYVEAGLAALKLEDEATIQRLIEFVSQMPPAKRSPLLRAGAARFAGLLAARHGDGATADERLGEAIRELRAIDAPFVLAQVLCEHAELLHADGRGDEAASLLAEAIEIFARLRATPHLERAQALQSGVSASDDLRV